MSNVLGALSFLDIPDVNGVLLLTAATGITSISGTTNQISISGSSPTFTVGLSADPIVPGVQRLRVPNGATTDRPSVPGSGDIRYNTTLSYMELFNGYVWQPLGRVLQVVSGTISAATGTTQVTTAITSAPTTSDGFSVWSRVFTPISASSKILIHFSLTTSQSSNARTVIASCFAGSINIGSVATYLATSNLPYAIPYSIVYSPGSTSAITFTCRVGSTGSGTTAVSQVNTTTGTLGGAAATEYTITEIL